MPVIKQLSAGGAVTSVGVVVVVFDPDATAVRHVEQAHAGAPLTVVVDNTPRPDPAVHERWTRAGITVVANRNAGGLARAYNLGVRALIERGCELCFLLDQDSEIEAGFFDRMAQAARGTGRAELLIGPRIHEIRMAKHLPAWATDEEVARGPAVRETDILISSGSAVSARAYERLGGFREDLFIEWIDIEYALRAAEQGIGVFVNIAETLHQMQGDISRHGDTFTTNHAAWRRYYHVRNGTWTGVRYGGLRRQVRGTVRLVARECWVVLRHERHKGAKVLAVLVGALDGFRGRLGEVARIRPRTARRIGAPAVTER